MCAPKNRYSRLGGYPVRILFLHRWFGVRHGGTETHIREISTRLAKKGHVVHVLTREGKVLMNLKDYESLIKIWTVTKNIMESDFSYPTSDVRLYAHTAIFALKSFFKLLCLKLKGLDYDVVSVHFFTEALLLRMFKWLFRWPYLFFLEGYTTHEAWEAKYADLQMANSRTVIDKCYRNFGYKPLLGLVGTDTKTFKPEGSKFPFDPKKKIVLTVSRLAPQKNLHKFVEAARFVCEKDKSFLFLIGGEGSERPKLERLIESYNLEENVVLTGAIDTEELPLYHRSADIFVVTEFPPDETLITIIEAMSSGTPVVSTSPTGKFEVVGQSGVISPYGRPDILAEKIIEVAYNDKLYKEMIERGLRRAKRYDWDRLAEVYERACKFMVKINSSRSSRLDARSC